MSFRHQYSPNVDFAEDPEAEMYWMQMADFYEWPHIQYFNDLPHLKTLLQTSNFSAIHHSMKTELRRRKQKVTESVCDIIHQASLQIYNQSDFTVKYCVVIHTEKRLKAMNLHSMGRMTIKRIPSDSNNVKYN